MKKKLISDEELAKIKAALENLMETRKPYLDSELNLIRLAEMLSVSTHHLSYVINTGLKRTFFNTLMSSELNRPRNS
ncbi:hypothetical protein EJ377_19570 [Chryseobacterium arthrosphaerae]|uniref:AraC family transcriptional regulator n=1 Tax=Chryseobacterium arthrosphaerae TaxID=651561 RepID=A0A3S0N5C2_9FLAO|nr:hypothetical protein EJ377_19570 [Chryseobacterium arthrosphaerae]